MYGTVARVRAKPGALEKLLELTQGDDMSGVEGYVGTTVYQMDVDPNEFYMAVVFSSKEAYVKNAESPEQNSRYEAFMELLEGPPEWHDGEVVYSQ
jgi:quinol monooxygenase YgiN